MSRITIIGSGSMGSAIGGLLGAGGAEVSHISRAELGRATIDGDIVIIAVPYPALADVISAYSGQLDGKVVVDVTNPLASLDALAVPPDSSAAAELQRALPNARVVKAFNTNSAATLVSKMTGERSTGVFMAGDDSLAKETLAAALEATGVTGIDVGALARARELESIGFLYLTLLMSGKTGVESGFALVQ